MDLVQCFKSETNLKTSTPQSRIKSEVGSGSFHTLHKSPSFVATDRKPPFYTEYVVGNFCQKCKTNECNDPYNNPTVRARIYECQLKLQERTPCYCDSETLFEVMKGLYECHKLKDCENCNCILCGNLPSDFVGKTVSRRRGEIFNVPTKDIKIKNCLLFIADHGLQLPEGKTSSQKKLIAEANETRIKKRNTLEKLLAKGTGCGSCKTPDCINPLLNPAVRAKLLECQMSSADAVCCCACDSDVLYKIMKGMYECYKNRDSMKCECILCGHLPCEDLKKGQKLPLDKISLRDKPDVVKDKIVQCLTEIAKTGMKLPNGRTESEKALIERALKKSTKNVGFSPEPPLVVEKSNIKSKVPDKTAVAKLKGKKLAQKTKTSSTVIPTKITDEKHGKKQMRKDKIPPVKKNPDKFQSEIKKYEIQSEKKLAKVLPEIKKDKIPSEKKLVDKLQKPPPIFAELKNKTPIEKERIIKSLAKRYMLLPTPTTPSEIKLIEKILREIPPPTYRELKGNTSKEIDLILRNLATQKRNLSKPKTPSEEKIYLKYIATLAPNLNQKVEEKTLQEIKHKNETSPPSYTDLKGKSPEEMEKAIKNMAKQHKMLPVPKTPSENKIYVKYIIEKNPKTFFELKYATLEEKEKIIKILAKLGKPLPVPKTKSQKKLVEKIQNQIPISSGIKITSIKPSREQKSVKKDAQVLVGNTTQEVNTENKIMNQVKKEGKPVKLRKTHKTLQVPEHKSSLENKNKLLKDLPPPSEGRSTKNTILHSFTDLKGKTQGEKEQILRNIATEGGQLPKPKTESQNKLIKKINKQIQTPTTNTQNFGGEAKTISKKEKINKIKDTVDIKLKTATSSEEKFIHMVRKDIDIPSFTALKTKPKKDKEIIIKNIAKQHFILPTPRTPSENKLIEKIKKELPAPSFTMLKDKTISEKELYLKAMARQKLPLPHPKTKSQKLLVQKIIQTSPDKQGIEKQKIPRTKAQHHIPLSEPKTSSEKKMIDQLLKETPPLREEVQRRPGKQPVTKIKATSDMDATRKLTVAGGVLPKPRASEIVRKKSTQANERKHVRSPEKRKQPRRFERDKTNRAKDLVAKKLKELSYNCERACGCDIHKPKFKETTIRLHVTSPDISSLCDCKQEPPCIPTKISGVSVNENNEIVLTVAAALGAPSCTYQMKSPNVFQQSYCDIYRAKSIIKGIHCAKSKDYLSCTLGNHSLLSSMSDNEGTMRSNKSISFTKTESLLNLSDLSLTRYLRTLSVSNLLEKIQMRSFKNTESYDVFDLKHKFSENSDCMEQSGSSQCLSKLNVKATKQSDLDAQIIEIKNIENSTDLNVFNLDYQTKIKMENLDDPEVKKHWHKQELHNFDKKLQNSAMPGVDCIKADEKFSNSNVYEISETENLEKTYSEKVLAIRSYSQYPERGSNQSNTTEISDIEKETVVNKAEVSTEISEREEVRKTQEHSELTQNTEVDDFFLKNGVDASSLFLLIPLDDQSSDEGTLDTNSSLMILHLSETFSDQRYSNHSVPDVAENNMKTNGVLLQDRDQVPRQKPSIVTRLHRTSPFKSKRHALYQGAASPRKAYNSPMVYPATRSRLRPRKSAGPLPRTPVSSTFVVDNGYGYPVPLHYHREDMDYDMYGRPSKAHKRVRPNPAGFTFTRLPKSAARSTDPDIKNKDWEKQSWRDQWRRPRRSDESSNRNLSSGKQQVSWDAEPEMYDDSGRLACSGCLSQTTRQQEPPVEVQYSSQDTEESQKPSFFKKLRSKYHRSPPHKIIRQDAYTMYETEADSESSSEETEKYEVDTQTDKRKSRLFDITAAIPDALRKNKFWGSTKSTSKMQDSITCTHSYSVFGIEQGTSCEAVREIKHDTAVREIIHDTAVDSTSTKLHTCDEDAEPCLHLAWAPTKGTNGEQENLKIWKSIYEDVIQNKRKYEERTKSHEPENLSYKTHDVRMKSHEPQNESYSYVKSDARRRRNDSAKRYRDIIGPHVLLGYWEDSNSKISAYPQTLVLDCISDIRIDIKEQTCGCALSSWEKDRNYTVESGCGSGLLVQSDRRRYNTQRIERRAPQYTQGLSPKIKIAKPPRRVREPPMRAYTVEVTQQQTGRRMRQPGASCSYRRLHRMVSSYESLSCKVPMARKARETSKLSKVSGEPRYREKGM